MPHIHTPQLNPSQPFAAMAKDPPISPPLHTKLPCKNSLSRALSLIIFLLLLSLLLYRIRYLGSRGPVWLVAFLCEALYTFIFVLYMNCKWNPVDQITYPHRLLEKFGFEELPPVDMFVTTADHLLEPPIVTVNTVLSLLAVDYPTHKLACYVSDDGGSPITYYSLVEACKFAHHWVPFCKKYGVQVRAPFMYFADQKPKIPPAHSPDDFIHQWGKMKDEYEDLCRKIDVALQKPQFPDQSDDGFDDFRHIQRGNHPSIVKVVWENKERTGAAIPHVIYVAREKRPKQSHHFKAGAMNVLTRVSGVMTNAAFTLNVDCDMFVNNPEAVLQAMCLLLGHPTETECAFVQFPQRFYGGLKDDPFGNQMYVPQETMLRGTAGIQGVMYAGTGCFHRRKVLYGQLPPQQHHKTKRHSNTPSNGKRAYEIPVEKAFGHSRALSESVSRIMCGEYEESYRPLDLSDATDAAKEVADCGYELNTCWGNEVGWVYGSTTEDVLTGLKVHALGWGSVFCTPDPPAFLGCAPTGGPATLSQLKRWTTGLLEILVSPNGPLPATIHKNLSFRQCMAYVLVCIWAPRSIPELCYAFLPAFSILANTSFLPKASDPWMIVFAAIFTLHNLHGLAEYLRFNLSIRNWWNNQRISKITSATASLFGALSVLLKLLGISDTIFEVTRKDQNGASSTGHADANSGRFTFDSSPIFVPPTTLVLVHMVALFVGLRGLLQMPWSSSSSMILGASPGLGEMFCSTWVLLCFLPFLKGLVGRGSYGIPWVTILKAGAWAFLFLHFSYKYRQL